ncbi:hypothetical protein FQA39_LY09827 [Lamprigera yunnana]|nr:hypothetical protein FQA39_LY09827 [Lamprigera yunnana]
MVGIIINTTSYKVNILKKKRKKQNETAKTEKLLSKFLRVEKSSVLTLSELAQHQHAKEQDLFKKSSSCVAREDEEQHVQEDFAIPRTSSRFQNIMEEVILDGV